MSETIRVPSDAGVPSWDPRTGTANGTHAVSSAAEVDAAIATAHAAAEPLAATPPSERAEWMLAVAEALQLAADEIVAAGERETGLGRDRLHSELATLLRQWRFYAAAAREGSWLGATIDHATDSSPDLRRVGVCVGVVAVFGASNFPLTYGMVGHDTASALAAGSPVVVKAHPAHPRLGEVLAGVIVSALAAAGAPAGTVQVVSGFDAGRALVSDPRIGAVAFTGSQGGGMALLELARTRPVPIPVYAEMGTVNPVIITTARSRAGVDELAQGFVQAVRFGSGQVCTKPGMVFVPRGTGFPEALSRQLAAQPAAGWALTEGIARAYRDGLARLRAAGATEISHTPAPPEGWGFEATMLTVAIDALCSGSVFVEECFGPVGIVVEYDNPADVVAALGRMQGALTASVFPAGADDSELAALLRAATQKVGRVVVDQWPSGVTTTWAQHHGGPWPATTDPHATSVGERALLRFVRPVAFQNLPDALLPPSLQEANPWNLPRRVDGTPAVGRRAASDAPAAVTSVELAARRESSVARGVSSVSPFYIHRARGEVIETVDGDRFIDFGSGIAVTSVGHGDPRLLAAISEQSQDFLHTCFMLTPYEGYVAVCEQLNALTPGDHDKRTALFSTGAEALENAVKIARTATGRTGVVVFEHAYHGRTQLTMSMTSKYVPYKKGFGPFAAEVHRLPMAYPLRWPTGAENAAREALEQAETIIRTQIGAENVAAIVIEPIQGEGGFIVPPTGFLTGLRALADDIGALLVADEVQTGFGRTGAWFAMEHEGVVADLVTTGKALASGMPLAAVTGRAEVMDAVHAGGLGGTYAGNPVACAAALATIDIMRQEDLPARAEWIGEQFARVLGPIAADAAIVGELRGRGAMQALEIVGADGITPDPHAAAAILEGCRADGVIALTCGTFGNVLRFLPPLTISPEQLDAALAVIAHQVTTVDKRCAS